MRFLIYKLGPCKRFPKFGIAISMYAYVEKNEGGGQIFQYECACVLTAPRMIHPIKFNFGEHPKRASRTRRRVADGPA